MKVASLVESEGGDDKKPSFDDRVPKVVNCFFDCD